MSDTKFRTDNSRYRQVAQNKLTFPQKMLALCTVMLLLSVPDIGRAQTQAAHKLAGFVLGGKMADYRDRVQQDTTLPIRYFESLREVETVPLKGYKTAVVIYGTCIQPERIVRLKFKYADSSRAFYEELLAHFKELYGDPDEWLGDAFHTVLAWKWSFIDENKNKISLILQHNTQNEEEKEGNAVKLTLWNLMREEARCFENRSKQAPANQNKNQISDLQKPNSIDWNWLVPQP
jgi:hypothetical protein